MSAIEEIPVVNSENMKEKIAHNYTKIVLGKNV